MSFYEARTEVVGADDIDRTISRLAVPLLSHIGPSSITDEELVASCKRAKEALGEKLTLSVMSNSGAIEIPRRQVEDAISPLTSRIVSTYVETVRRAYVKEKRVSKWHTFTLFLLGGGTRFKPVADRIIRSRPSEYNRDIRPMRLLAPPELEAAASAKSNFDLLAVAYGLSFSPVDFPEILNPSKVEPFTFNRPRDQRLDRDELYPK
jgi:molecular chaperone DnaK (HSP70)